MLTLYTFVKAMQSGSLLWCLAASVSYLYTAASWGGHVLIPNLLALYMLCLLLAGSGPLCVCRLPTPSLPRTNPILLRRSVPRV